MHVRLAVAPLQHGEFANQAWERHAAAALGEHGDDKGDGGPN